MLSYCTKPACLLSHRASCVRPGLLLLTKQGQPVPHTSDMHTTTSHGISVKIQDPLADCYAMLNLREGCNSAQLRDAYIRMAKSYHPDSGAETADPVIFKTSRAYGTIKERLAEMGEGTDGEVEEPQVVFDICNTAPQHRQYLNFEGIGFGTPTQRMKQYQQHRVGKATESISDLRVQKIAVQYEDALVVKDKQAMKTHKTQNFMDRLVEDLIKESIEKGDFQDLPGTGKPLVDHADRNPIVDYTTHNLNKILINDGFAPEWITLEREIRQEIRHCRETLAKERNYLGSPPLSGQNHNRWVHHSKNFRRTIDDINAKIHKYNMVVPYLQKQMVEYNKEKEVQTIFENWEKFLPR
ncbi:LOW QUALITY PROTEIN: dnaJ homolog subfamily C member 28-like [Liolophura sinensis]|uniref:LOW QUALITY PROTEIN: dnaJ homolog subfamily C member 28-like n=1 Tax=Liolophura sinensis TaxID=3198878 RepID=UPI00315918B7